MKKLLITIGLTLIANLGFSLPSRSDNPYISNLLYNNVSISYLDYGLDVVIHDSGSSQWELSDEKGNQTSVNENFMGRAGDQPAIFTFFKTVYYIPKQTVFMTYGIVQTIKSSNGDNAYIFGVRVDGNPDYCVKLPYNGPEEKAYIDVKIINSIDIIFSGITFYYYNPDSSKNMIFNSGTYPCPPFNY